MLSTYGTQLWPGVSLGNGMERLFRGLVQGFSPLGEGLHAERTFPALNLWEEGDSLFAEVELPGLSLSEIQVSVLGNELTLEGERNVETPAESSFQRRERTVGKFKRSIELPVAIDPDQVKAHFQDGVLSMQLPKAQQALPRRIEVQSGKGEIHGKS
ncbi:MAG: Hsp20/alpha crystallin family protein [Planctomycetota bacterium]